MEQALTAKFILTASTSGSGIDFPDAATAEKVARGAQRYILRQWRKVNDLDKKEKPEGSFLAFHIAAQPVDENGEPEGRSFVLATID